MMDCRSIALLTFAAYTGAFQLTTSSSEATVGVNFSLICTANQEFISFKKNSQLLCITNGIQNGSCNLNVNCPPDYLYQCNSANLVTFKLTIPGSIISESLHGSQWSCESVFGIGTPSNIIQLHVNIPISQVTIRTTPIDRDPIEVASGTNQNFICSTDEGRPSSKIHWYMSGANITDSSSQSDICNSNCNGKVASSSVLVYTGNPVDDGKNIYCTASNTEGKSVRSYNRTVIILYRPVVSVFPIYNPYNVIENTTDLHLTCRVIEANPEVASFRWYKDGAMISTASTFIISRVQRSHQGIYTCDGNNSVGYSNRTSEMTLNVFYGVKLNAINKQRPVESKPLSIICTGRSNPDIADKDVTWTKQANNTFRHTGQRLKIDHVNTIDSGIFICNVVIELKPSVGEVMNIIGTTPVEVEVLYRPLVKVSPSFNPYNVVENATNLQLTCTVTKSNTHIKSYRWYKDSSVVSTDVVYTIPRVERTHYGLYTCEATNTAGSGASTAIQLNVLYGITLNPIHMPKPHEGLQLIMTCNGSSNPLIKDEDVTWSKRNNDTFTQTGTKLVIKNINILDGGTYICTVLIALKPSVGQSTVVKGTTIVMVDVLFKPMADEFKLQTKTVIGVKENDKLFLNIHLVANPIPLLQWSFIDDVNIGTCSNNTISSNDTFQGIHVSTSISILNLQKGQFGTYILISKNSIGVFSRIYTVVLQGNPSPPLLITVLCKSTSALVLWTPGFDGGHKQGFYVRYWKTESMGTPIISKFISDNIPNQTFNYEVRSLDEKTKYTFSIISTNEYGNASSGIFECVTDALFITDDDNILDIGIGLLVIGSVAVVGVAIFSVIFRVRKQILKSSTRMREYGEGGTTRNPAYSTSYDTLQDGDEKQTGSTNEQTYTSINAYEECGNRSYESHHTQEDTTGKMEKTG